MLLVSPEIQPINPSHIFPANDGLSQLLQNCPYLQIFGVKKHRATRLHYDFRLAWSGVLLSWAVPLGPSYNPYFSREAIEVEDHRKKYLRFEGVYPKGKPGAGVTMLWDRGFWIPMPGYLDVDYALRRGELQFVLQGEKLRGTWTLRRTADKNFAGSPIWTLTKEHDSYARGPEDIEVVQEQPNSVLKGWSLEEIDLRWREPRKSKPEPTLFEM